MEENYFAKFAKILLFGLLNILNDPLLSFHMKNLRISKKNPSKILKIL
jgi:hypothetical protein